jgi:uncharacterized membrane protein YsdA (DUF1294 family)
MSGEEFHDLIYENARCLLTSPPSLDLTCTDRHFRLQGKTRVPPRRQLHVFSFTEGHAGTLVGPFMVLHTLRRIKMESRAELLEINTRFLYVISAE